MATVVHIPLLLKTHEPSSDLAMTPPERGVPEVFQLKHVRIPSPEPLQPVQSTIPHAISRSLYTAAFTAVVMEEPQYFHVSTAALSIA
jgi:hypothetical protein